MLRSRAGLMILGVTLLGLGGCGGGEASLTGVWEGAFKDSLGGLGGGSFTFTQQSGASLQGSWQVFFQTPYAIAKFNSHGLLTGTVDGSAVTAMLTSEGPCSFAIQATVTGRHMSGTYTDVNCAVPETGSFDLEKS
jgi:hypothetical protein